MFRFYTPILILQFFCLYHAYKNKSESWWYILILMFPLVGCLIYLYKHFYSRQNVERVSEGVKQVINTNYHVDKMEKQHRFNDSVGNRINLADAYCGVGRFEEAVELYESCREGYLHDDPGLIMKLMVTHFQMENYRPVVELGKSLEGNKDFEDDSSRVAYAWSLHHLGDQEEAYQAFEIMDVRFSHYGPRLEFCKFLDASGKRDEARERLDQMLDEISHMTRRERKPHLPFVQSIQSFRSHLR
ncbi:tetratricopeptide repeat protein [bacterium SCSIO 12741]|nr:tetratricopeptide repeat protein [bacterium SCSIO 12741]